MNIVCDCDNDTFHIDVTFERAEESLYITGEAVCTECGLRFPIGDKP